MEPTAQTPIQGMTNVIEAKRSFLLILNEFESRRIQIRHAATMSNSEIEKHYRDLHVLYDNMEQLENRIEELENPDAESDDND